MAHRGQTFLLNAIWKKATMCLKNTVVHQKCKKKKKAFIGEMVTLYNKDILVHAITNN